MLDVSSHTLDLAPPAPPAQRESVVHADATQSAAAPADLMATVLALLQEQKGAMSEQKAAMERLETSQGQNLNELEAIVVS